MINSDTYDHTHRLRSYEFVSEIMKRINGVTEFSEFRADC